MRSYVPGRLFLWEQALDRILQVGCNLLTFTIGSHQPLESTLGFSLNIIIDTGGLGAGQWSEKINFKRITGYFMGNRHFLQPRMKQGKQLGVLCELRRWWLELRQWQLWHCPEGVLDEEWVRLSVCVCVHACVHRGCQGWLTLRLFEQLSEKIGSRRLHQDGILWRNQVWLSLRCLLDIQVPELNRQLDVFHSSLFQGEEKVSKPSGRMNGIRKCKRNARQPWNSARSVLMHV